MTLSPSRRSPRVGFHTLSLRGFQAAQAVVLVVSGSAACAVAQEAPPAKATREYIGAIAQAQADLDGGRVSEARERLEATDKSLRSFEYEYLLARAQAAPAKGPAPDLVRKVANPDVETRYGVLNQVDRQLVFICRDGRLRVRDLNAPDGPAKTVSDGQASGLWSGAFSRDGRTFVAGHESGDVAVWDAKTWKVRHTVSLGSKRPVRELAVAPDGSAFVAEGQAELELWSLAGERPKKVAGVGPRYNFGEGLAFSPKGDLVATGGLTQIVLYNARTGEKTKSMHHQTYTTGLEFSPDGNRIASAPFGDISRLLAVFDVGQGTRLFNARLICYVHGLAFTPDGKRIVATACDKVQFLRLFDAATGNVVFALRRAEPGIKPAVSRDGRLLGWSEQRGGYRFIDLGQKPDTGK